MSRVLKFAAAAAAVFGAIVAPAGAQGTSNNALAGSGGVMSLISASDVAAMMTELGVASELVNAEGTAILVAETEGGGRFLFRFFGCANEAQAVNCRNTIITAGLPSAGITYEDLNTFNGNSIVTTAVNVPEQQIVLFGRNIIVLGGHSRDLFKGTVYLFLNDVSSFAQMTSSASSVAFAPEAKGSKISGVASTVPSGPKTFFGLKDISQEVSAAIANTNDVSFKVNYTPEQ